MGNTARARFALSILPGSSFLPQDKDLRRSLENISAIYGLRLRHSIVRLRLFGRLYSWDTENDLIESAPFLTMKPTAPVTLLLDFS